MLRPPLGFFYVLLAGQLLVQPAGAAELYLSGELGNSGGNGTGSVSTDFFDAKSDDVDASPAYGGSIGLAFALDEALPAVKSFELPSWIVRTELEFLMGRDYELRTDGAGVNDFFLTEVDAWTLMPNVSLEVPVRSAVSWMFGRIPVLEPMSLYGNLGIGTARVDLDASDTNSSGSETTFNFAWQAGAGLSYALTDTTSFTLGWRYISLGTTEAELSGIQGGADYELELSSHEIVTGLRVNFYTAPLVDMHPRNWRAPRVPLPDLPSWLGGGDADEEASDEDEL
jgi:opacity protein-like surface antigen